jgi:hypothetical protein
VSFGANLFSFNRFNIDAKFGSKRGGLFSAHFWLCGRSFFSSGFLNRLLFFSWFCIGIHFDELAHNWRFYCR